MAQAVAGIVGGIAGIGSAVLGANAAESAGAQQAAAAREAAAASERRFEQIRNDLIPFIQAGYSAQDAVRLLTGTNEGGNPLTAPLTRQFNPSDLENTPGYQFTLNQGLKGVQNSYAARGLGSSGAAMKGAARYATGHAQNTFNQQLSNDLTQRQATYNMLFPQSTQGANSAGNLGSLGLQSQGQINNLMTGAAQAQASGTVGVANAYKSVLGPAAQYAGMYAMDPSLFQAGVADAARNPNNVYGARN